MKFMPRFDLSRRLVWLALLVAVLLVLGPLHALVPSVGAAGKITSVDTVGRVIAIDGVRYTLAQQAEIYKETDEGSKILRLIDLRIGQSVEFEVSGKSIISIRVLE